MPTISGLHRVLLLLPLALAPAACSDEQVSEPPTEFIVQRRAWLPGERDSLIARIIATRGLNIPYVGDVSDNAGSFFRADSMDEIVANPAYVPAARTSPFGPTFSLHGVRVPGTGWTSSALDIHIVNADQGNDTFDWLGVFWFNQTETDWMGFILAATANATLPQTQVNTTAFDAAEARSGVGGGEGRASTGTVWTANGTGSPNRFRVTASAGVGAATTVTTGPYLGGTQQSMNMTMNIAGVGMTRVLGSGTPLTQTASLSGTITGTKFDCLFPTPCTTNVPLIQAAARRGAVPDSLMAHLPWRNTPRFAP